MNDQLTIGVIGHVDHGKTSLVKELTGIETDRLKEEKERGLSIVLGFAYFTTPRGTIDFIDAPGHADFVRTMISGVSGIDAALIVVAANERIMPQTIEHIRIVTLLGIDRAVIALTKSDLVSKDELDLAEEEVRQHLSTTPFASAPMVPVSVAEDSGIENLKNELAVFFNRKSARPATKQFYLPLDRVFTMKGHGAVATGTLNTGRLKVGSEATLAPANTRARVRGLQVHGKPVEQAEAGQRVAVNFRLDGTAAANRGDTLLSPDWIKPSLYWDGSLSLLSDAEKPLKSGEKIRILHGTSEHIAALRLLDRDRLQPGETANVQLRLAEPAVAWHRERFIARSVTPVATIGGGQFTDTQSRRRSRKKSDARGSEHDPLLETLATILDTASLDGVSRQELQDRLNTTENELAKLLDRADVALSGTDLIYSLDALSELEGSLLDSLQTYHQENPAKAGIAKKELGARTGAPSSAIDFAIERLLRENVVAMQGNSLHAADFDPLSHLTSKQKAALIDLEQKLEAEDLMPPTLKELVALDPEYGELSKFLVESQRAFPIYDEKRTNLFFFHTSSISGAVKKLRSAFPPPQEFRAGEAREVLGTTRKYAMPLLAFLDKQKITKRNKDFRHLVQ